MDATCLWKKSRPNGFFVCHARLYSQFYGPAEEESCRMTFRAVYIMTPGKKSRLYDRSARQLWPEYFLFSRLP